MNVKDLDFLRDITASANPPYIVRQKLLSNVNEKEYFYIHSGSWWYLCMRPTQIVCKVTPAKPITGKKYIPVVNLSLGTIVTLPDHTIASFTY